MLQVLFLVVIVMSFYTKAKDNGLNPLAWVLIGSVVFILVDIMAMGIVQSLFNSGLDSAIAGYILNFTAIFIASLVTLTLYLKIDDIAKDMNKGKAQSQLEEKNGEIFSGKGIQINLSDGVVSRKGSILPGNASMVIEKKGKSYFIHETIIPDKSNYRYKNPYFEVNGFMEKIQDSVTTQFLVKTKDIEFGVDETLYPVKMKASEQDQL